MRKSTIRNILGQGILTVAVLTFAAHAEEQSQAVKDANAGAQALDKGENENAIQLFTRALSEGGLSQADTESAYVERAKAYLAEKENDLALADLNEALKLDPNDKEAVALRSQTTPTTTAPSGPSLQDAVSFIQNTLNTKGTFDIVASQYAPSANANFQRTVHLEVSNVSVSEDRCTLSYHAGVELAGVTQAVDERLSFKDVAEVRIMAYLQYLNQLDAADPNRIQTIQIDPEVYALVVARRGSSSRSASLGFPDQQTANDVMEAIEFAAKSCKSRR